MANSLAKLGSYIRDVTAGVDLMPLILEDANEKLGINLSKNFTLRHVTIYDPEDGNIYKIDKFPFEIMNGNFSTAMIGSKADNILIESIVPEQDGECKIYYVR